VFAFIAVQRNDLRFKNEGSQLGGGSKACAQWLVHFQAPPVFHSSQMVGV